MINLIMFSDVSDLEKLTGLDADGLWDAGFNLDDWDVGFRSDEPLGIVHKDDWDQPYVDWYDTAHWLGMQMDCYCVGCNFTEYGGKYYYLVYHS